MGTQLRITDASATLYVSAHSSAFVVTILRRKGTWHWDVYAAGEYHVDDKPSAKGKTKTWAAAYKAGLRASERLAVTAKEKRQARKSEKRQLRKRKKPVAPNAETASLEEVALREGLICELAVDLEHE